MTEAMLMMRGSSAFMRVRMKPLTVLNAPLRLVSMTVSQSSSFMRMRSVSRVTPALLMRMLGAPISLVMRVARSCTAWWSATSTS